MPITAGKIILRVGALRPNKVGYSGDYKIKVSPYFFKNETGRLAMDISSESMAAIGKGKVTTVTGVATTDGKDGASRRVVAVVRPVDIHHGTVRLSFMAGNRPLVFEPAYQLVN